MATIKFSALVNDMRGKLNGSVFSATKAGNVLRNRAVATIHNSIRWTNHKSRFAPVVQAWRSLSKEEQEAWDDSALSVIRQNKVGDTYTLTGYNYFTSVNLLRLQTNEGITSIPPAPVSIPDMFDFDLNVFDGVQLYNSKPVYPAINGNGESSIDWVLENTAPSLIPASWSAIIQYCHNMIEDECGWDPDCWLYWTSGMMTNDVEWEIGLQNINEGLVDVVLKTGFEGAWQVQETVKIPLYLINGIVPLTIAFTPDKGNKLDFILDGKNLLFSYNVPSQPASDVNFQTVNFRSRMLNNGQYSLTASVGFIESSEILNPNDPDDQPIIAGYDSQQLKDFSFLYLDDDSEIVWERNSSEKFELSYENESHYNLIENPARLLPSPMFSSNTIDPIPVGWELVVWLFPPSNLVITDPRKQKRIVGVYAANGDLARRINYDMRNAYAFFPNGSRVNVFYQLRQAGGGVVSPLTPMARSGKKVRFKAGAGIGKSTNT